MDERTKMKAVQSILLIFFCLQFFSCRQATPPHGYAGIFHTEDSIRFELREDSVALIVFPNQVTYESSWSINSSDASYEFVNIEFAGNRSYYFLKGDMLYRSEREMRHRIVGSRVYYKE